MNIENHMVITTALDIAKERQASQWESAADERTQEWSDEIESCFADVSPKNFHRRVFPKVNHRTNDVETVNLSDVIERLMDTPLADKIAEVIANVDHPMVRELRDMLCKDWVEGQADLLADVGEV